VSTQEAAWRAVMALAEGSPHEVCGFFSHEWDVISVRNVHRAPARGFAMDEDELLALMERTDGDLLGVWHSHPGGNPYPSDADESFAFSGFYRYFIVTSESVYEWKFTSDGPQPVDTAGRPQPGGMAIPLLEAPEALRHLGP
jgi:proteasome lid subunit RPN8/RPN11